jgi:hypothetical protein
MRPIAASAADGSIIGRSAAISVNVLADEAGAQRANCAAMCRRRGSR